MLLALAALLAVAGDGAGEARPADTTSGAGTVARTVRRPSLGKVELAVGPWVGQHAPQEPGSPYTGFAWGGRARVRWTEVWGLELAVGANPEGAAGNLAVVRFLGNPSADLVAHLALGAGMQADRNALLSAGGGFDIVLTPLLDLRADGRLEIDTPGTAALLFAVSPMFHTRRAYDADVDGVPDRDDRCPQAGEDRDGHDDADGCPDPDNDNDGVPDLSDACVDVREDPDGVYDKDGCPDPDDDEDGVFDALDSCRAVPEDLDGFADADGCPDPDNDGDLVRDEADRCADVGEDTDGWQDDDGCPDPDNDGDGVADRWDDAPFAAEVYNGWQDEDGVPDIVPPVVARLLGGLGVRFVACREPGCVPTTVRAEGDGVALLGAVLASFPGARVTLEVAAYDPARAGAHAAALVEALTTAGAAEEQLVVRIAGGAESVTVALPQP